MQVKVRVGMSLSTLAQRYHTTVDAIAEANGIKNKDLIRIGEVLQIPDGNDSPEAGVGTKPAPTASAAPTAAEPTAKPEPQAKATPKPERDTLRLTPRNVQRCEVDSLVRAVAAEARGESPSVWKAIAQTILNYARENRVSVPRLVRTSYLSSNFDGNRKFYTMPMSRIPNEAGIRDAVIGACNGESSIGRRSHFHDTSIGTPRWGDRSTRVQIGHVVFFEAKNEA